MGKYVCFCKLCKAKIISDDQLKLMILKGAHEKKEHLLTFVKNKDANDEYKRLLKVAEQYKIYHHINIFGDSYWDGFENGDEVE